MEEALSHLLTTDRVPSRSTLVPANTPHPATLVSNSDPNNVTHAWLLEQCKHQPVYLHPNLSTFHSSIKSSRCS